VNARVFSPTRALIVACAAAALPWGPAAPAAAQDRPASPARSELRLTLDEAIARALDTSHRIGEGRARADAAQASADAKDAADRPVVSLLGGYMRTNHIDAFGFQYPNQPRMVLYPDVPDNVKVRLDLQWPVYTSGRVPALERAAVADQEAAGRDVNTFRAEVRLDVTRAFWSLVMARETVRVVEESVRRVESHLKDVKAMREVGLMAPNDVLSVEARHSRERVLLIEARNARDVAEADLRRAAGLAAGIVIDPAVPAEPDPADLPAIAALLDEARLGRPERQALELRIAALRDRGTAASAGRKPMVSVAAGVDYARPNPRNFPRAPEWNPGFDVGVNVAWALWDGGRVSSDVAEVAANRRAAEERLAEFDRQLEFDVTQRRLDIEAARAAVGAASDGVAAAAEAHRVVVNRFKAGLVSNTEVMEAQVALIQAQLERTRAATAVRLAMARLDRALGR
jgi:outer membrane protein TolC